MEKKKKKSVLKFNRNFWLLTWTTLNAFWINNFLSDKTKIELFGNSDKMYAKHKVCPSNLRTLYYLSSKVVVASCCGAVFAVTGTGALHKVN